MSEKITVAFPNYGALRYSRSAMWQELKRAKRQAEKHPFVPFVGHRNLTAEQIAGLAQGLAAIEVACESLWPGRLASDDASAKARRLEREAAE